MTDPSSELTLPVEQFSPKDKDRYVLFPLPANGVARQLNDPVVAMIASRESSFCRWCRGVYIFEG
jgi:hypothetical protein